MKICIPFKERKIGGPQTFVKKFTEELKKRGVSFTHNISDSDYDVVLVIVSYDLFKLWQVKKKGIPIIQRLDGVYFFSIKGLFYPLFNLKMKTIRNFMADYIIYQSQYSKKCCDRFLGKNDNQKYSIIYNGVDLEKFSPKGEKINLRDYPDQKILFTANAFRRKDMIVPILESVEKLLDFRKDFKLVIAGSYTDDLKKHFIKRNKYIQYIGLIPNDKLPKHERGSDVFLFTALNPSCPNNIIEAMACGLPINGCRMGAMEELVTNHEAGELVEYPYKSFWKIHPISIKEFTDNLNKILNNLDDYKIKARKEAEQKFSLDFMIDKYLEVIKNHA